MNRSDCGDRVYGHGECFIALTLHCSKPVEYGKPVVCPLRNFEALAFVARAVRYFRSIPNPIALGFAPIYETVLCVSDAGNRLGSLEGIANVVQGYTVGAYS
jgi:hypothetical protein